MNEERKAFQHLPAEENPQFLRDGLKIFSQMKQKYPKNNVEDLDNILNGMCAALTCLMETSVNRDNHRYFIQLIHKILSKNIKEGR